MLSGVDLRVRRMETRASTLPTFRESSDCGLSTCWPAKVELLIADAVAMILILTNCHTHFPAIPFLFSSSSLTYLPQSLTRARPETTTTTATATPSNANRRHNNCSATLPTTLLWHYLPTQTTYLPSTFPILSLQFTVRINWWHVPDWRIGPGGVEAGWLLATEFLSFF